MHAKHLVQPERRTRDNSDPGGPASFQRRLLRWHLSHQRDFSWRRNRTPYRVLIAELFLQRTQAQQIVPVFRSFLREYPTPARLARARLPSLRRSLRSLGLIGRASRLREMAREIVRLHGGRVPGRMEDLLALTGVGRYAAAAVLCFAFGIEGPIVDANVVRVLQRVFGLRSARARPHTDDGLWDLARRLLPLGRAANFNYALLDLAALVCLPRKPRCPECAIRPFCAWAALPDDKHGAS